MKWPVVKLGTVADVVSGFGFPRDYQGDKTSVIPFFKVGDMNLPENSREMRKWTNTVSVDVLNRLKARAFPSGTVIFPKIGAAIATGKKRILTCDSTFDNNVMGLVPTKLVDPRFLYYWSLTFDFTMISYIGPVPSIRKTTVESLEFPLPPLSEQRRIVEILDQADALRKKRAEANATADRTLAALFVRMFGDPATNPKEWEISTLDDVTKTIHRYPTFYGQEYVESGVAVVRISDILPNHILSTQINKYVRVPKEFSDKFPLTILQSKDLVMAVRGDTTGKIGLVPDELTGSNISPNLIRISPKSTVVNPYYFFSYMLLASSIFLVYITNTAKKSITAKNIKSIPIFIPPMSLQDQFGIMVSRILVFDEHRLTSRNRIEELLSTLLHRAFSSQLTATWREAHMQELLAEIEQQAKWLTGENTPGSHESASLQQSLFRDEVPD
jgi:type I restriction enzyme S subunit